MLYFSDIFISEEMILQPVSISPSRVEVVIAEDMLISTKYNKVSTLGNTDPAYKLYPI